MTLREKSTVIGIDPTTHGLAFVVFDGGELLDWGCSERNRRYDEIALLDRLVGHYGAELLVIEDPDADGCRRGARVKKVLRNVREYAGMRRLRVRGVPRQTTREVWRASGKRTNEAIAAAVAETFPVLRALVPPPRKLFMAEDERVRIFGAITLVLAATKSFPPRFAS